MHADSDVVDSAVRRAKPGVLGGAPAFVARHEGAARISRRRRVVAEEVHVADSIVLTRRDLVEAHRPRDRVLPNVKDLSVGVQTSVNVLRIEHAMFEQPLQLCLKDLTPGKSRDYDVDATLARQLSTEESERTETPVADGALVPQT